MCFVSFVQNKESAECLTQIAVHRPTFEFEGRPASASKTSYDTAWRLVYRLSPGAQWNRLGEAEKVRVGKFFICVCYRFGRCIRRAVHTSGVRGARGVRPGRRSRGGGTRQTRAATALLISGYSSEQTKCRDRSGSSDDTIAAQVLGNSASTSNRPNQTSPSLVQLVPEPNTPSTRISLFIPLVSVQCCVVMMRCSGEVLWGYGYQLFGEFRGLPGGGSEGSKANHVLHIPG